MTDLNWPDVLVAAAIPLLLTELTDWLPQLSEWTVRQAACRLTIRAAEREVEWLAMLDHLPGKWSKLAFALSCVVIARASLLNEVVRRSQQVLIWTARVFLVALPGGLYQGYLDHQATSGLLVAGGVALVLLIPALGRRSFDPQWVPDWKVPAWMWWAHLLLLTLVALDGLWVKDYGFTVVLSALMMTAYGRDLHQAGIWRVIIRRRPAAGSA